MYLLLGGFLFVSLEDQELCPRLKTEINLPWNEISLAPHLTIFGPSQTATSQYNTLNSPRGPFFVPDSSITFILHYYSSPGIQLSRNPLQTPIDSHSSSRLRGNLNPQALNNPPNMILGPVTLIDCFVFLVLLIPQLLWTVGIFETVYVAAKTLPFLCMLCPVPFVHSRPPTVSST